ncbi:MAG: DUF1493 family protein [Gammaproteobacteria bacterium]|nr:DUF1493 family protein [Gammaproteobacteria bacterium]
MEKGSISDQVFVFLSEFSGVNRENIELNSDIVKTLHLEGDDAIELLKFFGDRFKVNISKFDVENYFVPEIFFNPFYAALKYLFNKRSLPYKSLLVKYFVCAAMTGSFHNK